MQIQDKKEYFSYLPISLFGAVMGLCAMCVAWSLFAKIYANNIIYDFSKYLSSFFGILALFSFIALCFAYGLKLLTSFESAKNEFNNPLTKVFFGTFCIALLLLPLALNETSFALFNSVEKVENLSLVLWILGVVCMLVFAVYIANFWICHKHELSHITPAWIIPVVGLLDIPLFMPYMNLQSPIFLDLAKFCVGVGLFFALVLIPLILARIIFFEKLPSKLMPTLLILLAPFGVGFSAWSVAFGIDEFAKILFFIAVFLFSALLPQIFKAYQCCPFRVTWWAISFPLVAFCIAGLKLSEATHLNSFSSIFNLILLCFVSLVFLWLICRTLKGILSKELKNLA